MFGALKRRWKTTRRTLSDDNPDEIDKEGSQDIIPPRYVEFLKADKVDTQEIIAPRYIEVRKGKIVLEPSNATASDKIISKEKDEHVSSQISPIDYIKDGNFFFTPPIPMETCKNTEVLEARIAELEDALVRLQDKVNQSQCNSPTLEKEIKEHLEIMNKAMKTKDRKSIQTCREHKSLQARYQRQENSLQLLQNENKSLHQRVSQYESCLDDVMRKVVDALVAEDSLREEVSILKNRVRDLEAQNATLSASPVKGKDEGYCTMSSGQPQPLQEGHLEDLPEEPEQWLLSAEPCTAEMEDWSMSQEELATALDEDTHDWIWNSSNFLTTAETQTEDISEFLLEQLVHSDDEEVACKNFTRDFYRLVSFNSDSNRSLHSPSPVDSTCSSDENDRLTSPTPSEAGLAQVISCSSSDSSDILSISDSSLPPPPPPLVPNTTDLLQDVLITCHKQNILSSNIKFKDGAQSMPTSKSWRRSNGWRRVSESNTSSPATASKDRLKSPPPVPVRRSYAS